MHVSNLLIYWTSSEVGVLCLIFHDGRQNSHRHAMTFSFFCGFHFNFIWFSLLLIPRIDESHCDRIHSSLIAVCCFDNGYVGKQPVAWKGYSAEYCLKELQENINRCTGRFTEILLKTALNIIQSINQ